MLADGEAAEDPTVQRAVGCMVGMAIADSIGHNFEFMPAQVHPPSDAAAAALRGFPVNATQYLLLT